MTEVVDRNIGSDMSALLIDFLRRDAPLGMIAAAPELNAGAIGVEVPDTGGVLLAE
jgi:hypothetical protein